MMQDTYKSYRRWILYFFSLVAVFLSSGICYGWPSIRRALLQNDNSLLSEKSLGAIYTAGAWTTQGGRFFFGLARDRLGTKAVACFSLLCVVSGALGLALSGPNNTVGLAISFGCIGLGSGTQLCLQPVAELFPQNGGIVMSSLSGAFMMSTIVPLVITSISTNRRATFIGYAICIFILLSVAIFILPKTKSFTLKESNNKEEQKSSITASENKQEKADSAISQMCTKEYLLLIFWFSASIIPMQYYIGTIGFQLERKGDENGFYTSLQQIIFSSSAVLSPFFGFLADKFGVGLTQGLANIFHACAFFILSSDVISLDLHVLGLTCYALGRLNVFAMYFVNIGKRFGYKNYGTLVGVGLVVSALVSLLQYPLIAVADDGYAAEANIGCGFVFIGTMPYCIWLGIRERKSPKSEILQKEVEVNTNQDTDSEKEREECNAA